MSVLFKCFDCDFSTKRKALIAHAHRLHLRVKKENRKKPVFCFDCHQHSCSKKALFEHQQRLHWKKLSIATPDIECFECRLCYTTPWELHHHHQQHHLQQPRNTFTCHSNMSRVFVCFDCCFSTTYWKPHEALVRHWHRQHMGIKGKPKNVYSCFDCEFSSVSGSSRAIALHSNRLHRKSKFSAAARLNPIECFDCKQTVLTTHELGAHQQWRHLQRRRRSFACYTCKKSYKKRSELVAHDKLVHLKIGTFACFHCTDRSFGTREELFQHTLYRHHREACGVERTCVQCPVCHRRFARVAALRIHGKLVHSVDGKKYRCQICSTIFSTSAKLQRHRVVHSAPLHSRFVCYECGTSCKSRDAAVFHARLHNVVGAASYKCDQCDYSTPFALYLRDHKRTHSGQKRHVCQTCGWHFLKATNLRMHIASSVHSTTTTTVHRCQHCGKESKSMNALRLHLRKFHNIYVAKHRKQQ